MCCWEISSMPKKGKALSTSIFHFGSFFLQLLSLDIFGSFIIFCLWSERCCLIFWGIIIIVGSSSKLGFLLLKLAWLLGVPKIRAIFLGLLSKLSLKITLNPFVVMVLVLLVGKFHYLEFILSLMYFLDSCDYQRIV